MAKFLSFESGDGIGIIAGRDFFDIFSKKSAGSFLKKFSSTKIVAYTGESASSPCTCSKIFSICSKASSSESTPNTSTPRARKISTELSFPTTANLKLFMFFTSFLQVFYKCFTSVLGFRKFFQAQVREILRT